MSIDEFKLGPEWSGESCCGKPVGCTDISEACTARNHPWKQRNVARDPEWTFEPIDEQHVSVIVTHADGTQLRYRVRRRPVGAVPETNQEGR